MTIGQESSIKRSERTPVKLDADAEDERDTVLPNPAPAWSIEDAIETWPESEPPEAETLRPPAGEEPPEELPPDSDDLRDTVPSPPPPPGAIGS